MKASPSRDPVGYVLDMLWADLTKDGEENAVRDIQMLVASRMYPEALALAIAVEVDRARRREIEAMYLNRETITDARLRLAGSVIRNLDRLRSNDPAPPDFPPPPPKQAKVTDAASPNRVDAERAAQAGAGSVDS